MNSFWPWYIAGPLIGLFVPLMYIVGAKAFGISSSFDHLCHIVMPGDKKKRITFDAEKNSWKLYFVIGIAGGAVITQFLFSPAPMQFLPPGYYQTGGYLILFIGGLFVGFGTRYGNGCTSGHAITGLSLLNPTSLYATLSFFITGALFTWAVYLLS